MHNWYDKVIMLRCLHNILRIEEQFLVKHKIMPVRQHG